MSHTITGLPHHAPTFSPEALRLLLSHSHVRRYAGDTEIIRPGDCGDILRLIREGGVSVSIPDGEGREVILAYLSAGDFLGELGVFLSPFPREVTVRTRSASVLAEITYDRFHHLVRDPATHDVGLELLYAVGRQLSERLLRTSRRLADLALLDVTGRIARLLMDLAERPEAMTHPDGMQIHVSRQEIARMVGCSREMAGRVLKELETRRLIDAAGKTIVVRRPA